MPVKPLRRTSHSQGRLLSQTVWLSAPGELEWRAEAVNDPNEDEILCETVVSAISPGTELAAWRGLPPLSVRPAYPRVLGYCNVARVLDCGKNISGLAPGDHVLSHASHRSHFLLSPEDFKLKLDDDCKLEHAACSYLFHLGYDAVMRSNVRPGSRVAVIGMGALGLAAVAIAKVSGAKTCAITSYDSSQTNARKMGAETVLDRKALVDGKNEWAEDSADVVIVTTNGWTDWQLALQMVSKFGQISCLGFPGRGEGLPPFNPLDSQYFYTKQVRIEAVGIAPMRADQQGFLRFNLARNVAWIVGAMKDELLNASIMISGHYEAADIVSAYRDLDARKGSPVTFLLDWSA